MKKAIGFTVLFLMLLVAGRMWYAVAAAPSSTVTTNAAADSANAVRMEHAEAVVETKAACAEVKTELENETEEGYKINSPEHVKFMLKKYGCS